MPPVDPVECVSLPCLDSAYIKRNLHCTFATAPLATGVGVLRLGWLTHYLSHAVISGFMTGASITIGMSQVKYLLGERVLTNISPGSSVGLGSL